MSARHSRPNVGAWMAMKHRAAIIGIVGIITLGVVPAIGATNAYFTDQQTMPGKSTSDILLTPTNVEAKATGSIPGISTAVTWANAAATQKWGTAHEVPDASVKYTVKRSTTNEFSNSLPLYNGSNTSFIDEGNFPPMLQTRTLSGGYSSTCGISTAATAYCWGAGTGGLIGDGDNVDRSVPTPVSVSGVLKDKRLVSISSHLQTTCTLDVEGAAYCWGYGGTGQLGDGLSTGSAKTPVAVSSSVAFKTLSVGAEDACASSQAGTVYCWGKHYGPKPTALSGAEFMNKDIVSLAGGDGFFCAIDSEGAGYCWGSGTSAPALITAVSGSSPLAGKKLTQINMNQGTFMCVLDDQGVAYCGPSPAALTAVTMPNGGKVTYVSAGNDNACAVSDGAAYCWGPNAAGQNGTSGSTSHATPTAVSLTGGTAAMNGKTITSVFVSTFHACALDSLGASYCWGGADNGRLGYNSLVNTTTPVATKVQTRALTFLAAPTGGDTPCAIEASGIPYCWGKGLHYATGNGTEVNAKVPTAVDATDELKGKYLVSVQGKVGVKCALDTKGVLYCWGDNEVGAVGDGTLIHRKTPHAVGGALAGKRIVSYSVGTSTVCAIDQAAALYCWGQNSFGAIATGTVVMTNGSPTLVTPDRVSNPTLVTGFGALNLSNQIASVSTNAATTCALSLSHHMYCWGLNDNFQFGIATPTKFNPTPVWIDERQIVGTVAQIAVSENNVCVLAGTESNGNFSNLIPWCVGLAGRLGSAANVDTKVYVQVDRNPGSVLQTESSGSFTSIDSLFSTCVLDTAGKVFCWGWNEFGELGDGTPFGGNHNSPVAMNQTTGKLTGKQIVGIGVSNRNTCTLDTEGKAYCVGYGVYGQLGNNTIESNAAVQAVKQDPLNIVIAQSRYGCGNGSILITAASCSLSTITQYYYQVSYKYLEWQSPATVVARTPLIS